ncbi:MAG: PLP-dependent aminotransferase family protein [Acidobacteriota bacterium]|nr:PLP-dependent aminotransferase family protein [Acidobacteriota bacterium]
MSRSNRLPLSEIHTIQLDQSDPEPLYRQLYRAVREAILLGRFPPGIRLPSSRAFARELNLSRNTVVNAYDQLTDEGFLERRHGSGSYITETIPDRYLRAQPKQAEDKPKPKSEDTGLSQRGRRLATQIDTPRSEKLLPFMPGLPDLAQIPLERWSRLVSKHWRDVKPDMLGYGNVGGLPQLRKAVAEYLKACRAVTCHADQVIITAGAQQGLDLACRLLLDEGDTAWLETPGYHGAQGAMISAGIQPVRVPMDREGIDLAAGKKLAPKPRLIYVTPSHQYPTGITMSLARRLDLLANAETWGSYILEDDYDSEFRYDGRPLASLQGLDTAGRVIYVGTFSKVLFPALRLGYLVVPDNLIDAFLAGRCYLDRQAPSITQAALAEFIESGWFLSHVRRMRHAYAHRYRVMNELVKNVLSPWLSADPTPAGMHLTAYAKGPLDDQAVHQEAKKRKLLLRPLTDYYPDRKGPSGFVLGYAGFDETQLRRAAAETAALLEHAGSVSEQ